MQIGSGLVLHFQQLLHLGDVFLQVGHAIIGIFQCLFARNLFFCGSILVSNILAASPTFALDITARQLQHFLAGTSRWRSLVFHFGSKLAAGTGLGAAFSFNRSLGNGFGQLLAITVPVGRMSLDLLDRLLRRNRFDLLLARHRQYLAGTQAVHITFQECILIILIQADQHLLKADAFRLGLAGDLCQSLARLDPVAFSGFDFRLRFWLGRRLGLAGDDRSRFRFFLRFGFLFGSSLGFGGGFGIRCCLGVCSRLCFSGSLGIGLGGLERFRHARLVHTRPLAGKTASRLAAGCTCGGALLFCQAVAGHHLSLWYTRLVDLRRLIAERIEQGSKFAYQTAGLPIQFDQHINEWLTDRIIGGHLYIARAVRPFFHRELQAGQMGRILQLRLAEHFRRSQTRGHAGQLVVLHRYQINFGKQWLTEAGKHIHLAHTSADRQGGCTEQRTGKHACLNL